MFKVEVLENLKLTLWWRGDKYLKEVEIEPSSFLTLHCHGYGCQEEKRKMSEATLGRASYWNSKLISNYNYICSSNWLKKELRETDSSIQEGFISIQIKVRNATKII